MKNTEITSLVFILLIGHSMCLHLSEDNEMVKSLGGENKFLQDSHNYYVSKQGNVVWAGALTLAWHQLTDNIVKEDIKLNSQNNVVQKIVENYNKSPFTKNALSEQCYYAKSGYGQKTVDTINKQVKEKFPKKTFSDIKQKIGEEDIISYAYLAKSFQYPVKFKVNDDFKFKNKTVKGFKASTDQQRDQVSYLYYENPKQFLIKLQTKKEKQGVYLLRTKYQEAKVQDIIAQVNGWEKHSLLPMSSQDYFEMPIVNFDYSREVPQIQKIQLLNPKFESYIFAKVYEALKLKIDQTGLKVQNQGTIIMKVTSIYMEQAIESKYFVLDDTFWIILKQQSKHPYLCIKVNTPVQKEDM